MIYQFAKFRLDTKSLERQHNGQVVEVGPQVLNLLTCLIENPNRVISKGELIEPIWDGRVITDGAISRDASASTTQAAKPSIAVLPFENLSYDREQATH